MAIGERIRFFRNMKGITQKYLGMVVGFPGKPSDNMTNSVHTET
jgi:transcriptional regulator with XRE-family HTH domain